MLHKRTPYVLAAAALAVGAGAGAGSYAAFGGQNGNTTTVVRDAAATGSPARKRPRSSATSLAVGRCAGSRDRQARQMA